MDRRAPVLVCLALLAAFSAAQERKFTWTPEPGVYSSARIHLVLAPGFTAEYRFRDNGDGVWRPFSEALDLTAFPLEERGYSLQVRGTNGEERFEGEARYVIDRLPPEAPSISPPPGSYEGPVRPEISAERGAVVFYSLEAQDRPSPGFKAYDPSRPPELDRPRDGTRSWTLSAYAVDAAGNPGPVATALYVVEPDPSGPSHGDAPQPPSAKEASGWELEHRLERRAPGAVALVFPAVGEARMFAAVNPGDPGNPRYYTEIASASGGAALELTAPTGWTGPLVVRYARMEAGGLSLAPNPVEVRFAFEDPGQPPPPPPEPRIVYAPGTRTALLSWDPSPYRIEVSVGSGPYSAYSAPMPVSVPEGAEGLEVRYRSVSPSGASSPPRSAVLTPPRRALIPEISDLPEGGVTNREVRPRAPRGIAVRYEVSEDGLPPPVTASSALLDEDASFPGTAGRDTRYTLRLRAFSDATPGAAGSDERFVTFVVDRSPPPAPRLAAGSLSGEEDEDRIIAFEPGEGTIRYAAVERGTGAEPVYRDYAGPVVLEGSGERPLAYDIYAYAVDEAGNRSETLGPVAVRIDRASVYVAPWGSDAPGSGGPRNPLATLSAAVEAAARSSKRFVRIQGDVGLGEPVRTAGTLEILGGCDESWEPVPGRRSAVEAEGARGPWFIVQSGELSLTDLSVHAEGVRDFTLAEVSGAALTARGLSIRIDAAGDLAVVRATDSRIDWSDSFVELSGATFARLLEASGGDVRVRALNLRAEESIGYLTAFSFAGGTAGIERLRAEIRTAGGFTLVRGVGVRFELRESYVRSRGTGICEAFRFEGSSASLYLASADLACEGPLVLASAEGARVDILHGTFILRGGPIVGLDLRDSPLRLGNSVIAETSGAGILLRSDETVQRGSVFRNAFSGFRTFAAGAVSAATLDALNLVAAPPDGQNFLETFTPSGSPGSEGLPLLPPGSQGRGGAYPIGIPSPDSSVPGPVRRDVGAVEGAP